MRDGGIGTMEKPRFVYLVANSNLQVVLLHVFRVFLVEELIVLVKLLSVTCAALVACSHLQRSGESGIRRSTWDRSELFRL
jgi:hypothetical protein